MIHRHNLIYFIYLMNTDLEYYPSHSSSISEIQASE